MLIDCLHGNEIPCMFIISSIFTTQCWFFPDEKKCICSTTRNRLYNDRHNVLFFIIEHYVSCHCHWHMRCRFFWRADFNGFAIAITSCLSIISPTIVYKHLIIFNNLIKSSIKNIDHTSCLSIISSNIVYKSLSIPTISMPVDPAARSVKPTMSLKINYLNILIIIEKSVWQCSEHM